MSHQLPGIYVSEIRIYPVKSLGGVRIRQSDVYFEGLKHDRKWMLVDLHGTFLSQRRLPEMSMLTVLMEDNGFYIISKKQKCTPLFVSFETSSHERMTVKVWDDVTTAIPVGREADWWLSEQLQYPVQLVMIDPDATRETYLENTDTYIPVSFADDFPLHLISEASLSDLNTRLAQPVGMERFRPNLVIAGTVPFAEDTWRKIRIGNAILEIATPCERCVMVNINQQTAAKTSEPLKTLAGYRKAEKKIHFGRNVFCKQTGSISEGDLVSILE
jgi:uncharacterized protein YcbX